MQANRDQSSGDSTTTFRPLGALLGWIFPGLGHIAAGNTKRGLLAMAGVLFLFLTGIAVGGIDSVDRTEDKLWFYAQAGCGPIAFATSFANDALLKSGDAAPMIEMPSPPGAPAAASAITAARSLSLPEVLATSVPSHEGLATLLVTPDEVHRITVPKLAKVPNGTGDFLSGLYLAARLEHAPQDAFAAAMKTLSRAIALSSGTTVLNVAGALHGP